MRRALIPTVLLVLLSVVLGATVFRESVAWAAQSVEATIIGPLDGNGNVKVHEQGTANVNVANAALPVVPTPPPVTGGGDDRSLNAGNDQVPFDPPAMASALTITLLGDVAAFVIKYKGNTVAAFWGPTYGGHSSYDLALTRPIEFDSMTCATGPTGTCSVGWIGAEP